MGYEAHIVYFNEWLMQETRDLLLYRWIMVWQVRGGEFLADSLLTYGGALCF